jgi:Streptomyces sporulation and cell division protein, SsgA
MSFAVEQRARAHVVTDAAHGDGAVEPGAVAVYLRYDPVADPDRVRLGLPEAAGCARRDWSFTRDLLERGLRGPAADGDVRVWPSGRVRAVVELHCGEGTALVQFDSAALLRFLRRTHAAAPAHGGARHELPAHPPRRSMVG